MKPIPVVFHIGPLQIHTYGIGLAVTFWFGYRYLASRLRRHGYPDQWLGKAFVWIIVASIVGARAAHVVANIGFYAHNPGDVFAIWHGGLSSFGGLALGVPAGFIAAHHLCKELRASVAADLLAPVLALAWAVGRLLGPQLMIAGGGRVTNAWYGMYYAGQVGRRYPVPIQQAIECFVIWVLAVALERWIARRGGPIGIVATAVVALYGLSRFFDEYVFLPHGTGGLAVEVTALVFVGAGAAFGCFLLWRGREPRRGGELVPVLDGLASPVGSNRRLDPWQSPASTKQVDEGEPENRLSTTGGESPASTAVATSPSK
ncbi:MAG: prolipoprotein diacylglyceryl transferase [Acidimicrobiales bacterium]